ncbi:long-chain fatty acid--CoA ligase [Streptomyces sp. NPDC047315]|uniref:acyl-CoA synthetase n=1 Tax=Streptomyces sp. NPDC047315 TaxID=3155142 RepID=UPI0034036B4F
MYLTQSLHRAVQRAPDETMTICGERRRSAREVRDRVARLAGGLRGLGVAEGDRVAILAGNSDRYHETFYASWWIAAAVTPVNLRWSPAEIIAALNDSGAEVLLVDEPFLGLLPQLHAGCPELRTVVYCGEAAGPPGTRDYEELIAESGPVEDIRAGGDRLAALVYTGGTTGEPKGVMVSHRSLLTSALGTLASAATSVPGGRMLVSAPMFHIAALAGWSGQNSIGGSFVFLPGFRAEAALRALEEHRITSLPLVPTMLQMLIDHPDVKEYDLTSVRRVSYGASAISESVLRRAMEVFPEAEFFQGYGMTETAMITLLGGEEHRAGGALLRSAGRPLAHCEVRIVRPDGTEARRGEVGEIVCRGDHLMLGYWNRPEETAVVLRDGWMHTGDGAFMDDDGYVFIADRIKDMIITGGENVYSGEVENALAAHPAVASCAVVGLPDEHWGERVHAVVVLRPGTAATEEDLQAHVRKLIAGYKVPRSVEFAEELPMSGSGKILKRELRAGRAC